MIAGILIARSAIKFIVSKESSIFLRMSAWQRKQCMSYCKSHVGLPRMTPFQSPQVAAHFDRYPAVAKKKMLALRELVFAVAAQTPAIGALQETLKWGRARLPHPTDPQRQHRADGLEAESARATCGLFQLQHQLGGYLQKPVSEGF
jgi:hypothetical protein